MTNILTIGDRIPDETIIWRYLDFTKLLSLISTSSLFFTRSDCFEDIYEGKSNIKQLEYILAQPEAQHAHIDTFYRAMAERENFLRQQTGICCWHMSSHESIAMWKIYLKAGEGVAIKSTYEKLNKSLIIESQDEHLNIGRVKYIDYDTHHFGRELYAEFFHKREFFKYENELRVISVCNRTGKYENGLSGGILIKVDLNHLIDAIVLAPSTPHWIFETIKDLILKYNYNFKIEKSKVDK
jgi:hypothetical protein